MIAIRQLQAFVAVAGEEHFGRAAGGLGVTTGTVSRALARLEREVGVELVRRTSRRVRLTAEGAALMELARSVVAAASAFEDRARAVAERRGGAIRVGVAPGCEERGRQIVAGLRSPGWEVLEERAGPAELGDRLRAGRLEVAVVDGLRSVPRPWWARRPPQEPVRAWPGVLWRLAWRPPASWWPLLYRAAPPRATASGEREERRAAQGRPPPGTSA
ncbi:LysR family transcriptional regulator [Patulibacter defluvii]|uniref:LysR family transcriptional regulator n=1 Tax=Patulibacter defluvii TaxID=3095358 RepID=UPI002A75C7DC|nr:LysR family transcriptional regulator [Patulibacter sp. DM4]